MRIPVEIQRNIVRYIAEYPMSNRKIGKLVKVSPNTVGRVRLGFEASGLSWETLAAMDHGQFSQCLGTAASVSTSNSISQSIRCKDVPDWFYIEDELKKRDVTLELLWQEFRETHPNGVSYSRMARLFSDWKKTKRLSMRQVHRAGEKFFVDFCGKTMPILNRETGGINYAQIFVGVMGASGYIFALAVPSQQTPDWMFCHIEAFKYLGGVPQHVVSDNLKSAVLKHGKEKILFNKAYFELAEHYHFAILPARPYKPKDKGLVEVSVRIVQQGVLAKLRNHQFFSIAELNCAIQPLIAGINEKTTARFQKSRLDQFLDIDLPVLQQFPEHHFEVCDWAYHIKVNEFYTVEWHGHFYSVPYQYAHQFVDLRVTANTIEIIYQRQRIASHLLNSQVGEQSIQADHMPPNHRFQRDNHPEYLLEWAKNIGPMTQEFVQLNLTERRDFANGLKRVRKLKKWVIEHDYSDRLESACAYAIQINAHAIGSLQSIIKTHSDRRADANKEHPILTIEHSNLRGSSYFKTNGDSNC